MHYKHLLILSLLVLLPILAFFTLGRRLVLEEQAKTRRQFEELLRDVLSETDRAIAGYFAQVEQELLRQELDAHRPEQLKARQRSEPLFEQIFVVAPDGSLVYPNPNGPMSRQEAEYLMKVEALITDRSLIRRREERLAPQRSSQQGPANNNAYLVPTDNFRQITSLRRDTSQLAKASGTAPLVGGYSGGLPIFPDNRPLAKKSGTNERLGDEETNRDYGWFTWYWGQGLQLIHWRGLEDGSVLAIGLRRARWMAEVIALLPDSTSRVKRTASPTQIRLVDPDGRPIYVWGTREPLPSERPLAAIHLSAPLKPWQLEHFGPTDPLETGKSATLINLIGSGGLLFVGLAALAFYLSREITRQTREARQRVNFVNQVSHELKTPLTNIRMYADLLELDLQRVDAEEDEKAQAHLAVITGESSRLSRLINNVLTFARLDRDAQTNRCQQTTVDTVVRDVVEQYQPLIDEVGLRVELDLQADGQRMLDVDALEQILGNLISNVEKYASSGGLLKITTRQQQDTVLVDVIDHGPGISVAFAKRIFEPFERASDHIEAATGTGIGLPIARGLARRCGGDLELLDSARGATFRLSIGPQAVETTDQHEEVS